jgi:transposase
MPTTCSQTSPQQHNLAALNEAQVRVLAQSLITQVSRDAELIVQRDTEIKLKQTTIDALTQEIRLLRHRQFAAKTEAMDAAQRKLFEEAFAEDLSAAEQKLAALTTPSAGTKPKSTPARQSLPQHLPRVDIVHEPQDTTCGCGQSLRRISEDVSERLDYVPGTLRVERHIRGVWACKCCSDLRQEAATPQIIYAGIPTARLLAQVLIAKYDDHLPLYRQSEIYAREGVHLSLSTLADWVGACAVALSPIVQALRAQLLQANVLHADESPVKILGNKGEKHKGEKHNGYIWAFATAAHEACKAVVYQVRGSRSGLHAKEFLSYQIPPPGPGENPEQKIWGGYLMVDDFAGYKALFSETQGNATPIVELGCWAHVRRKFFELHAACKSSLAQEVLQHIGHLYAIERQCREENLDVQAITQLRREQAKPRLTALHAWLLAMREQVSDGTGTARAMDYALKRWGALVRYADDGCLPIDNNRIENHIRPWAVGRKNWLHCGSLAAGQRAADIMSLIETAKLNGIEPLAYLTDVLTKLPTHPNSRIEELLPTRWQSNQTTSA